MRLSDEIGRKRFYSGQETHQAILLHDNAQLNDSNQRIYILIYILIWEILYHGWFSKYDFYIDFHLFRSLQHHLVDTHFQTPEEVENSITEFIESKSSSFFWAEICQLLERWQKCIESDGDYFQE